MIVAGFGFRESATLASLRDLLARAEAAAGARADVFATVPAKAGSMPLHNLAAERGVRVVAVEVTGVTTPTRSDRIKSLHGTGSVAEAAALAVAGLGARLTVTRMVATDRTATCAMAATEGTCP